MGHGRATKVRCSRRRRPSGSSSAAAGRSCAGRPTGPPRRWRRSTRASSTCAPWMAWASRAGHRGRAWPTFFAAGEELWDQRRDFGYSIVEGPDERVVGGCGLHGRLDEHGLEIGYWVHVDRIGQGLATEREPGAHRRRVRHPRHRAGADPVRRAQRPQRPGAREARLPAARASTCPTTGTCDGTADAGLGGRPGRLDREARRRPPRSLPRVDDRPIGMFDSGFGGLTVARALIDLLPAEHLVYLGDTGRYPYGPRAARRGARLRRADHRPARARARREAAHRRLQHGGGRRPRAPAGAGRRARCSA